MHRDYFVHPLGCCETEHIGRGTRIWAFAHVLAGARIGDDCNIYDGVFVEGDVVVGNRVTVRCGVQLWGGMMVDDDVIIGPNATFANHPMPRSGQPGEPHGPTRICRGASIGANATILSGLSIGQTAMVGPGAVVTRSVPPSAIVEGNPARISGYVGADTLTQGTGFPDPAAVTRPGVETTEVTGVTLHHLPLVKDLRGNLTVGEFGEHVPFPVQRYFLVFDVPSVETRGAHAHIACHQFLICVRGQCAVVADDGTKRQEFELSRPNLALHLPPMVWGIQYKYSPDAVLLVFASARYDPDDYIRDYDSFLQQLQQQ